MKVFLFCVVVGTIIFSVKVDKEVVKHFAEKRNVNYELLAEGNNDIHEADWR